MGPASYQLLHPAMFRLQIYETFLYFSETRKKFLKKFHYSAPRISRTVTVGAACVDTVSSSSISVTTQV